MYISSIFCLIIFVINYAFAEIPQLVDYTGGRYLDCYECHSNRPGCGSEVDWILMRWKRCLMPSAKCVKIIEKIGSQQFIVRGCLKEIEVTREDIPTVRDNGCWTIDGEYVGWGRNIFVPSDKTLYCFCDERDGCNNAIKKRISYLTFVFALFAVSIVKMIF